jgi:hypothetical protein
VDFLQVITCTQVKVVVETALVMAIRMQTVGRYSQIGLKVSVDSRF